MNDRELVNIAAEYMQAWTAGNKEALDSRASEQLTMDYTHFDRPFTGLASCRSMLATTHTFFPDLKLVPDQIIPSEKMQRVTVLWSYTGTHKQGKLFGIEASGKKVSVKGISLLEIQGGRVVRENGIVDNMGLMMQLGAIR